MKPRDFFSHCPRCGLKQSSAPAGDEFICAGCGFRLFFIARAASVAEVRALDGVESFCWLDPARVDLDDVAFPSMRRALELFVSGHP